VRAVDFSGPRERGIVLPLGIVRRTKKYDRWLLALEPAFADDLKKKLEVMDGSTGDFLRATFYRWAQRFQVVCPDLCHGAEVRAVGDVHVGNFGTWSGNDGHLWWGLNDFDEAGRLPFTNDLVRLATSALLERDDLHEEVVARRILSGYAHRVASGEPQTLDVADDAELATALQAARTDPTAYFEKLAGKDKLDPHDAKSLKHLCERLLVAVPGGELHHRRAGRGSLGRVRIFALSMTDPPVAIEAKRVLRSAWSWANRGGPDHPEADDDRNVDIAELLGDVRRMPDPNSSVENVGTHQWVLRSLSCDRVGVDFATITKGLATGLLDRMGAEVANVHLLSRSASDLKAAVDVLEPGWLAKAAVAMKNDTDADSETWRARKETHT
jgi:hypothetical protein